MRIGVKGLNFDAAHYTKSIKGVCENLHGHTFTLEVEVEGEPDAYGMVMDFTLLKKIVREVLEEWDHSIIIPEKDYEKTRFEGGFNVKVKKLSYPYATTEYIALSIAKEISDKLGRKVWVKVYEGSNNYVIVEYP